MSSHAASRPQSGAHRTGAIITLLAMLASATVLALALTGSFEASDDGGAVAPNALDAAVGGRALPVATHAGVRGVPLPGPGETVSPVVAPRTSEATHGLQGGGRIGVRRVPLPAARGSAVPTATSPRTGENVGAGQFLEARPGAS